MNKKNVEGVANKIHFATPSTGIASVMGRISIYLLMRKSYDMRHIRRVAANFTA